MFDDRTNGCVFVFYEDNFLERMCILGQRDRAVDCDAPHVTVLGCFRNDLAGLQADVEGALEVGDAVLVGVFYLLKIRQPCLPVPQELRRRPS